MADDTAAIRRHMVPTMPDELKAVIDAGGPIWDTGGLQADFEVIGFAAPFVVVRRKADGKTGSLKFAHQPRYYFGWQEDS